ncbi:hypothetical protein BJY04DRAFT_50369 [Aspergillus karnatakaensis]|uniref:uncharacterized protein n=1 Tax=Aspergillus karnatakaensis TaxID=1810916 RepID=UPI003CCCDBEE
MPRPSPSGSKPDKNMSSRLLTMKFMQRAAASAATKESSQPASNSGTKESPPKKRRVSEGPNEPATPSSDLEAISAALAEEESRRKDAVARQAAEAGETEWVLDFGGADDVNQYAQHPVVLADYSLDADDDDLGYGGRQSYGNYKKKNIPEVGVFSRPGFLMLNHSQTEESAETEAQETKPQESFTDDNLDSLESISGKGGRLKARGNNNERSQKKRKHK